MIAQNKNRGKIPLLILVLTLASGAGSAFGLLRSGVLGINSCARSRSTEPATYPELALGLVAGPNPISKIKKNAPAFRLVHFSWLTTIEEVITVIKNDLVVC